MSRLRRSTVVLIDARHVRDLHLSVVGVIVSERTGRILWRSCMKRVSHRIALNDAWREAQERGYTISTEQEVWP